MSEIEKMYENAGVYDFRYDCNVSFTDGDFGCITNCSKGEVKDYCTDKKYFKDAKVIKIKHLYPPFTAEKQIELIKWLARKGLIQINYSSHQCYQFNSFRVGGDYKSNLSEALASYCNNLWQDLTPEEKQQVRGILE